MAELIAKRQAQAAPSVPKRDRLPDMVELPDGVIVSDRVSDQHLATALLAGADASVCADAELIRAARACGMAVLDARR